MRRALLMWMVTVCLGTAGLIADRASAGTSCLLQVTAERGLLTVDALGAPLNEVFGPSASKPVSA